VVGTRRADAVPEGLTDRYPQVCLRWRPSAMGRTWLRAAAPSPRAGHAWARAAPVVWWLSRPAGRPRGRGHLGRPRVL